MSDHVIAYYEGTRWDYRHLWRSDVTGAVHFGYYDARTHGHDDAVRRMTAYLGEVAGVGPDDHVVDAGCGLGGCARWLARHRRCRVTGVNITPYQLEEARKMTRRDGLADTVDYVEADVTDTGLAGGAYSVVWALESLVHVPDRDAFLHEAARLLRPEGRLVIAEYLVRDAPDLTPADAVNLRTWCDGWAMAPLVSSSAYHSLLARHGFTGTRVIDISRNVEPSLRRLHRLVRLFGLTAPAFERLGALRPVPAGNLRAAAAQLRSFRSGAWRYEVILATRGERDAGGG